MDRFRAVVAAMLVVSLVCTSLYVPVKPNEDHVKRLDPVFQEAVRTVAQPTDYDWIWSRSLAASADPTTGLRSPPLRQVRWPAVALTHITLICVAGAAFVWAGRRKRRGLADGGSAQA